MSPNSSVSEVKRKDVPMISEATIALSLMPSFFTTRLANGASINVSDIGIEPTHAVIKKIEIAKDPVVLLLNLGLL